MDWVWNLFPGLTIGVAQGWLIPISKSKSENLIHWVLLQYLSIQIVHPERECILGRKCLNQNLLGAKGSISQSGNTFRIKRVGVVWMGRSTSALGTTVDWQHGQEVHTILAQTKPGHLRHRQIKTQISTNTNTAGQGYKRIKEGSQIIQRRAICRRFKQAGRPHPRIYWLCALMKEEM